MSRRIQTGPPPSDLITDSGAATALFYGGPLTRGVPERGLPFRPAPPPDGYLDRLIKYIPAEIIALYLGVINVIPPPLGRHTRALWAVSIVSALCVPTYMYKSTSKPDHGALWSQIVISSIAFPLWVFAIGGPFAQYPWYDNCRWIAAVIICFATFLFGLYVPAPAPIVRPAADAHV